MNKFQRFILEHDRDKFEMYYRTHLNEDVFKQYPEIVNLHDLGKIRKLWNISAKTKEEKAAIIENFCGGHDWVRFYAQPHGWLFAHCSYGVSAQRNQNEERRKFYFGNLDPYRMVANNAFQVGFTVDKQHWRADPYDNQVGEMETTDRGLMYREFSYSKETLLCEEIE